MDITPSPLSPRLPAAALQRAVLGDIVEALSTTELEGAPRPTAAATGSADAVTLRDQTAAAQLSATLRTLPGLPQSVPLPPSTTAPAPTPPPVPAPPSRSNPPPIPSPDVDRRAPSSPIAQPLRFAADAARASLSAGRPLPALALLDSAWPVHEAPAEMQALRAQGLLDVGRETDSAEVAARGLSRNPESSALRWMGAQAAARLDAPEHAAALLLPLLRQVPLAATTPTADAVPTARVPDAGVASPEVRDEVGVPAKARAALRGLAEAVVSMATRAAAPAVPDDAAATPLGPTAPKLVTAELVELETALPVAVDQVVPERMDRPPLANAALTIVLTEAVDEGPLQRTDRPPPQNAEAPSDAVPELVLEVEWLDAEVSQTSPPGLPRTAPRGAVRSAPDARTPDSKAGTPEVGRGAAVAASVAAEMPAPALVSATEPEGPAALASAAASAPVDAVAVTAASPSAPAAVSAPAAPEGSRDGAPSALPIAATGVTRGAAAGGATPGAPVSAPTQDAAAEAAAPDAPPARLTLFELRRTTVLASLEATLPPADRRQLRHGTAVEAVQRWLAGPQPRMMPPMAAVSESPPIVVPADGPVDTLVTDASQMPDDVDFTVESLHRRPMPVAGDAATYAGTTLRLISGEPRPAVPVVDAAQASEVARAPQPDGASPVREARTVAAELLRVDDGATSGASTERARPSASEPAALPPEPKPPVALPPPDPATLFAWLAVDARVQPAGLLAAQWRQVGEQTVLQQIGGAAAAAAFRSPVPVSWQGVLRLAMIGSAMVLVLVGRNTTAAIVGMAAVWWWLRARTPSR